MAVTVGLALGALMLCNHAGYTTLLVPVEDEEVSPHEREWVTIFLGIAAMVPLSYTLVA